MLPANGLPVELSIPTDELHRFYVDYSALPGGFYDGISVSDLLSGDFPAEQLAGSIVLIGPYAAGLSDYVTTAIDHASLMYGVEYQANVINQMLRQDFKTEVSNLLQAGLLFVLSAVCLWFFLSFKLRVCIAGLAVGFSWKRAALPGAVQCRHGFAIRFWFCLTVTVFFVGAVGFNYVQAALEKRKISATFKRYVAPEIVGEPAPGRD